MKPANDEDAHWMQHKNCLPAACRVKTVSLSEDKPPMADLPEQSPAPEQHLRLSNLLTDISHLTGLNESKQSATAKCFLPFSQRTDSKFKSKSELPVHTPRCKVIPGQGGPI